MIDFRDDSFLNRVRNLFAEEDEKEEKDNKDSEEEKKDKDEKDNEESDENEDNDSEDKESEEANDDQERARDGMLSEENIKMYESAFENLGKEGRDVLKNLEEYKFKLEQASRMVSQIPKLSNGLMAKRKSIDEISNKLYQLIFDVENTDISNSFEEESPFVDREQAQGTRHIEKDDSNGMPSPSGVPPMGGSTPPSTTPPQNRNVPPNPNLQ